MKKLSKAETATAVLKEPSRSLGASVLAVYFPLHRRVSPSIHPFTTSNGRFPFKH